MDIMGALKRENTYYIATLRDCHKRAVTNPDNVLFLNDPTILAGCLGGKSFLDSEFLNDLQEVLREAAPYDLYRCDFTWEGHTQSIEGKQTCMDFYQRYAQDWYDHADALNVVYRFKPMGGEDVGDVLELAVKPAYEELLSLLPRLTMAPSERGEDASLIDHLTASHENVFPHLKEFIQDRYPADDQVMWSTRFITKPSEEMFADYTSGSSACISQKLYSRFVVACAIDDAMHYGLQTCYTMQHLVPLTGAPLADRAIHGLNHILETRFHIEGGGLQMDQSMQGPPMHMMRYDYCSDAYDHNEEVSEAYGQYLAELTHTHMPVMDATAGEVLIS